MSGLESFRGVPSQAGSSLTNLERNLGIELWKEHHDFPSPGFFRNILECAVVLNVCGWVNVRGRAAAPNPKP